MNKDQNKTQSDDKEAREEWEKFKHLILNSTLAEEEKQHYIHSIAENGCLTGDDRNLLVERLEHNIFARKNFNDFMSDDTISELNKAYEGSNEVFDKYQTFAEENDRKIKHLADEYDKKTKSLYTECVKMGRLGKLTGEKLQKYYEDGLQKIEDEYSPRFDTFLKQEDRIQKERKDKMEELKHKS